MAATDWTAAWEAAYHRTHPQWEAQQALAEFPALTVTCDDPPTDLSIPMGDGPAVLSEGWGGWEVQERPGRAGITHWKGSAPYKQTIPLLFGAIMIGSVEPDLRKLQRLGRPDPDDGSPPPTVRIHGPVHRADLVWVVDNVELTDPVIRRDSDFELLRQGVTLTLLQFVDADTLKLTGAARNRARAQRQAGRTKPSDRVSKTYTVKPGDTLSKIAARRDVYGDASKWRQIATANGIRDPKNITAGQHLRIP